MERATITPSSRPYSNSSLSLFDGVGCNPWGVGGTAGTAGIAGTAGTAGIAGIAGTAGSPSGKERSGKVRSSSTVLTVADGSVGSTSSGAVFDVSRFSSGGLVLRQRRQCRQRRLLAQSRGSRGSRGHGRCRRHGGRDGRELRLVSGQIRHRRNRRHGRLPDGHGGRRAWRRRAAGRLLLTSLPRHHPA